MFIVSIYYYNDYFPLSFLMLIVFLAEYTSIKDLSLIALLLKYYVLLEVRRFFELLFPNL